ncbi:FAD:protein FMN transferase [Pseudarthrobacter albicanus]|uniref:FAD:protein FMN transferase n=1 Tax=Pseudarthrobacter albicanus TaxID=2823873 RepID=UPI0027DD21E0|nr:FAD:protein FMN transferase [Pseudarthrobacter albicanus]
MNSPALKTRTFGCMGTVISLTVPAGTGPGTVGPDGGLAAAAAAVERVFAGLDGTFSLYRRDSEASRLARGSMSLRAASAQMRGRYADAVGWRLLTDGAFSPERPDGVLDLSGLIKGYAIEQAGDALLALGVGDWCLNAGGDVLVNGSPRPSTGAPWQAGIVDPQDRDTLIGGCPLGGPGTKRALATSGSAERGDHIWGARSWSARSRTGPAGAEFRQVSVAAPDIITADVLATAIVAGGTPMLDRATDGWEIEVLAVRGSGELLATPGFRA